MHRSPVVGRRSSATNIGIRTLQQGDLKAVVAIEQESFRDPWSLASFQSSLEDPYTEGWCAILHDMLVGYIILRAIGTEAELMNVAVARPRQGQGIGSRLVDYIVQTCQARNIETLFLEVREGNAAAQALYRRHQFTVIDRRKGYYRADHADALVMRRTLRS